MNWRDIRGIQRRAAEFGDEWHAEKNTVLRGRYELARCDSAATAQHICDVNNAFGRLVNAAIMLQRRINDLRMSDLDARVRVARGVEKPSSFVGGTD